MFSTYKQGLCIYVKTVGPSRYRFRILCTFAGNYLYTKRLPKTGYERKADELATKLITHTIVSIICVFATYVVKVIGPMYVLVVRGEYAIPTGVIVPFVDPDTLRGYIINMAIQSTVTGIAFISIICVEIMSSMIINTFTAMADLVCFNMQEFSDNLRPSSFSYRNELEFRNILVQLQDLEAYFGELNEIYYWKFFLQPILTTGCVSLAVFAQLVVNRTYTAPKSAPMHCELMLDGFHFQKQNGWPSGYGIGLSLYFQMLVLCYMGHRVKLAVTSIIPCPKYLADNFLNQTPSFAVRAN